MLIDNKGRKVNPDNLPKGRREREAALAGMREVLAYPSRGHSTFFNVRERARLVGA